MADRLAVFDPQRQLSADIAEAWVVVEPALDESLEAAGAVLRRNPRFAASLPGPSTQTMVEEGKRRTKQKFTQPIDEVWVEHAGSFAGLCLRFGLSTAEAIATVHAGYRVFVAYAIRTITTDTDRLVRIVTALGRLEAMETESLLEGLNSRHARAEHERLQRHAERLDAHIGQLLAQMAEAGQSLCQQAAAAADECEAMLSESIEVATATQQSTDAMYQAARLTAQLTQSVGGIEQQISSSAKTSEVAGAETRASRDYAGQLNGSARKIERIVELIRSVAGQTRMLALNATIEAARAGEAGRGFSVVAGEVKSLAQQTSAATDDIARQIAEVQAAIRMSVDATQTVGGIIDGINEGNRAVLDNIGRQMDAVMAIAAAVEETALGTSGIATNAFTIRDGATRLTERMSELNRRVTGHAAMMDQLRAHVDAFRQSLTLDKAA